MEVLSQFRSNMLSDLVISSYLAVGDSFFIDLVFEYISGPVTVQNG